MRKRWSTFLLGILFLVVILQAQPVYSDELPESIDAGPFIDKVVYKVVPDRDQKLLALMAGEIDMDISFVDPYHLPSLITEDPDIEIARTLKNGYGYVSFDCEQYPTNISGFRRAFAYAFDKNKVSTDIMSGFSQTHDSLVPYINPFCIEDEFEWHYYDARPDIGNLILDQMGFAINSTTGWRHSPEGDPIFIMILHADGDIYRQIAEMCVDAFNQLHIQSDFSAPCNCDLNEKMVVFSKGFSDFDLSWLANEFWSKNTDPYALSPGFANATFDSWRNQLLYSASYEGTFDAAAEMQRILQYNVPVLVVKEDILLQPYRTDLFDGYIEDSIYSISGPWTTLNIKKLDHTFGGTLVVGVSDDFNLNFWTGGSYTSQRIYRDLHCGLYAKDPDQNPYPQIAKSVITETHDDDPLIPEGHMRFTFDINNRIYWSDGVPFTADDVIFTFNLALASRTYGNPVADDLTDLYALYSPNPEQVVLEFTTESYWHFGSFAYEYILPKHIFDDLSAENWDEWNYPANELCISCGPFTFTDYAEGEFYELSENPDYRNARVEDQLEVDIVPAYDIVRPFSFSGFNITWELDWYSGHARPTTLDYTVYLDGEEYVNGTHMFDYGIGFSLAIEVEPLPPGRYNFTLMLEGVRGGFKIDTVMVTIRITEAQTISIVSIPIIVIFSILVIRKIKYSK
ncbi:MAG: ABC transporter substrate-binding protein [Candidatus Thorarchaeota archaeon]